MSVQESVITPLHGSENTQGVSPLNTSSQSMQQRALRECVDEAMRSYFSHLDGQEPSEIYQMVLAEIEEPLLKVVMEHVRHNQSRAAIVLGLNRGTLRKKLKQYGML